MNIFPLPLNRLGSLGLYEGLARGALPWHSPKWASALQDQGEDLGKPAINISPAK